MGIAFEIASITTVEVSSLMLVNINTWDELISS